MFCKVQSVIQPNQQSVIQTAANIQPMLSKGNVILVSKPNSVIQTTQGSLQTLQVIIHNKKKKIKILMICFFVGGWNGKWREFFWWWISKETKGSFNETTFIQENFKWSWRGWDSWYVFLLHDLLNVVPICWIDADACLIKKKIS